MTRKNFGNSDKSGGRAGKDQKKGSFSKGPKFGDFDRDNSGGGGARSKKSKGPGKPERGGGKKRFVNFEEDDDFDGRKTGKSSLTEGSEKKSPYSKKKQLEHKLVHDQDAPMRLNRFISNAGLCSRREADDYIKSGLVTVNGKVVTDFGTKVSFRDDVRFNGERLKSEKKVYVLLNKPKDFVTTVDDSHAKRTVMDLVRHAGNERIYPVGRLDRMTTGVLLLTNDGDLTKVLTHPKYNKKKIYHVFLDKGVTKNDIVQISEGITLDDGFVKADAVSYADETDKKQVGIEIHSGKNRIVRRIFEHLGYKVVKLDRVYFAGLTKKNLPRGKWRFLTEQEISILKSGAYV